MPHIIVKLYSGRSEEQKLDLVDSLTKVVSEKLNLNENSISIAIEEFSRENWAKEVYKKDIIDNYEKLYKEPGYRPSENEFE